MSCHALDLAVHATSSSCLKAYQSQTNEPPGKSITFAVDVGNAFILLLKEVDSLALMMTMMMIMMMSEKRYIA